MATPARVTETEVRAQRRRFSAAYKLRILEEADACTEPGAIGALLRREGLYASHLTTWRAQRAAGVQAGLSQARGRKPQPAAARELARLRQENARLQAELAQAREVIAIQKETAARLRALAGHRDLEPPRR